MTIANVFLSPEKALIGTDTAAICPLTGELIRITKMYPIQHVNVVLTGRGTQAFLLYLYWYILNDPVCRDCIDFDSIIEPVKAAFDRVYTAMYTNSIPNLDTSGIDIPPIQEVILVGWSARLNKMRGVFLIKRSLDGKKEVHEIAEPGMVNPWISAQWGEQPEVDEDEEGMIQMFHEQVRHANRDLGKEAFGGRLMLATITRDKMTLNLAADLEKKWNVDLGRPIGFGFIR